VHEKTGHSLNHPQSANRHSSKPEDLSLCEQRYGRNHLPNFEQCFPAVKPVGSISLWN